MKKIDDKSYLFGLPLFSSSKESLLAEVERELEHSSKLSYIFTPNPEQIVQATLDKEFSDSLHQADWLIPDGIGLVAASRLASPLKRTKPLQERIPGVEIVEELLTLAQCRDWRVLLVGGRDYSADQLPAHNFVWTPGYLNIAQPTPTEEEALEKVITEFKPKIVFVAFGAPYQEKWALTHRELLESQGVSLVMVVGGSFDYLFGRVRRAPEWVRAAGFEWLFRLTQEPWRLKRQLRLPYFIWLTLKEITRR